MADRQSWKWEGHVSIIHQAEQPPTHLTSSCIIGLNYWNPVSLIRQSRLHVPPTFPFQTVPESSKVSRIHVYITSKSDHLLTWTWFCFPGYLVYSLTCTNYHYLGAGLSKTSSPVDQLAYLLSLG